MKLVFNRNLFTFHVDKLPRQREALVRCHVAPNLFLLVIIPSYHRARVSFNTHIYHTPYLGSKLKVFIHLG